MRLNDRHLLLDRLGAGISLACAVHCLAMPLVLALVASAATVEHWNHWLEGLIILSSTVVGVTAAVHGYRRHGDRWVPGVVAVAVSALLGGHWLAPAALELPLVVGGGLLLAGAHLRNLLLCRNADDEAEVGEELMRIVS
jgi:hypothetical protein